MRPRIPLTRPAFPHPNDFATRWAHVTQMSGQHSNFGPLWHEAARRIEHFTGGHYVAFPVSNGTDAVALAIYAASRETPYEPDVHVEAFTFAATLCAAKMVGGPVIGLLETDEPVDPTAIAVRTKWWGYARDLSKSTANDVVDAAGGFGDRRAFEQIGKESIVAVSFHATKNFPIGEGGAVLVPKHRELAATAVKRAMCFGFNADREVVESFGMNAKLDELRCSLLIEQLMHWRFFAQRAAGIQSVALALTAKLHEMGVVNGMLPPPGPWASLPVVPVNDARALVAFLGEHGVQCRVTYDPIDGFDSYERWQRECVAFPADMIGEEMRELCDLLDRFYGKGSEHAAH